MLGELGVTHAEASLFRFIRYGATVPPDDLPGWASAAFYNIDGRSTEEDCRAALTACLAKGWLQVIDDRALVKIADELREGRILGPIYDFPATGGVDFTHLGAELWRQVDDRCFPDPRGTPFAYHDTVHEKSSRYFVTREAAVAEIEGIGNESDVVSADGPHLTGPWRAQWWRRFPDGYRVDIEERRTWQGHCSGSDEDCNLAPAPREDDPQRLLHVLDRHNVSVAEWTVLAAVEYGPHPPDRAVNLRLPRSADLGFAATISEEALRVGLENCLRYEWLRTLDPRVIEEVHALLGNDPAFLAVPRMAELRPEGHWWSQDPADPGRLIPSPPPIESRWGEIDFSPAGAALYRTISAEWLGTDWEDGFVATRRYYREEHLYCEAEAGFREAVQELVAEGAVIGASRLVPIGPWCVHWWDRFPSGYRLELEIGESR